jgi:hypothetical protein
MIGNAYAAGNAEWREKLFALVDRMFDTDMVKAAGGRGWTAGGLLCHLAFWDQRAIVLLEKWKRDGIAPSPLDVDVVNESMRPFLNAIPAARVRTMVREVAQRIDMEIGSLDPDLLARGESEGKPVHLDRGAHRAHHMAQIEQAMA